MEASTLTVRGDAVDRLGTALVEDKAEERRHSINKRGVRNVHTFDAETFTLLTYERAALREQSWVMVAILVEQLDDRTATVAVFVGGGGRGPFKLEDVSMPRLLRGEESFGETGRFVDVLEDVKGVCESQDLTVETHWETETDLTMTQKIEQKVFDA